MSERWKKESKDFLDALTGGNTENPLSERKKTEDRTPPHDREKEMKLLIRQRTAGGRPRKDAIQDPLVTYNFKIRDTQLQALRTLSLDKTLTIRELLTEAVDDLLDKYGKNEK